MPTRHQMERMTKRKKKRRRKRKSSHALAEGGKTTPHFPQMSQISCSLHIKISLTGHHTHRAPCYLSFGVIMTSYFIGLAWWSALDVALSIDHVDRVASFPWSSFVFARRRLSFSLSECHFQVLASLWERWQLVAGTRFRLSRQRLPKRNPAARPTVCRREIVWSWWPSWYRRVWLRLSTPAMVENILLRSSLSERSETSSSFRVVGELLLCLFWAMKVYVQPWIFSW